MTFVPSSDNLFGNIIGPYVLQHFRVHDSKLEELKKKRGCGMKLFQERYDLTRHDEITSVFFFAVTPPPPLRVAVIAAESFCRLQKQY